MPSSARPTPQRNDNDNDNDNLRKNSFTDQLSSTLSRTWTLDPVAESAIERDAQDCGSGYDSDHEDEDDEDQDGWDRDMPPTQIAASAPTTSSDYSLAGLHRKPSYTAAGLRGTFCASLTHPKTVSKVERQRIIDEERSLLRDNNIIPPKHPQARRSSVAGFLSIPGGNRKVDESLPSEASPLLGNSSRPYGGQDNPKLITQRWQEAVKDGKIHTTWQREAKTLTTYAIPLMVTFLLQYSLTVASIFVVGHIGTAELGAVSLASMTANITGFGVYQGLATSLDTLAAQAYGSGRKKLVGLQMQRMIYFLWALTIPIAVIWVLSEQILTAIVPETEVAELAGLYLKVVILGAPGYAAFEAGKRFTQAQGLFQASLYVLLFCAPLNAFMNWFFVWKLEMGFVGAPLAVAITDNLLPLGLFIYVRFFSKSGMSCWNGFTKQAFRNWTPMIQLALPGLLMVEAEVFAFEILTFAASYFGVTALAAQSVLVTLISITWQIPFPLSIAASTRIANLIGATLADAAKITTKVAFVAAFVIGILNVIVLFSLRNHIPYLFTSDQAVIDLVSAVLPICAAFQLFDALAALCNGVLRGLGRQHFGGYVQLFCYYVIGLPISMATAFALHWNIHGLWTGVALALGLVAAIEAYYIVRTDWEKSVQEAQRRNELEA